jgi:hypothetical protein
MDQYFTLFVKEELFLEECEGLSAAILDSIGIKSAGQHMKILKASHQLGKS